VTRCAEEIQPEQDAVQPLEAVERQGHLSVDDGESGGQSQ
jgi:hypothetical protein